MAKQQKLWRLGMTEMVSPSPEEPQRADYNSARWSARWLFLLAIQKYAPAVLSDLRRRADESGAVHAWAQRWRLPLWVQPYAVETRRLWSENPDLPNGWIESGDAFADGKGELVTELSPHPPPEYDPRYETSGLHGACQRLHQGPRRRGTKTRLHPPSAPRPACVPMAC
jgi:hypothetical protein